MDGANILNETPRADISKVADTAPAIVFQPQKLKDVMDVVDLMGTVAARIRDESPAGIPMGGGGGSGQTSGQTTGTSTRDDAIAKIPTIAVMQQKLIANLEHEVKTIEKQAKTFKHSQTAGSGFHLNELYRKIRRLRSLIGELISASAEMIKRFYISVFIDRQPLVVTGGSLVHTEE